MGKHHRKLYKHISSMLKSPEIERNYVLYACMHYSLLIINANMICTYWLYIYIHTLLSPVKIMHENDMHVFGIKQCGIRCNVECNLCQM
jgi:hypothetical protein